MHTDDFGPTVVDDVGKFSGVQAKINRYKHPADLWDGIERFELCVAIGGNVGHTVTLGDP